MNVAGSRAEPIRLLVVDDDDLFRTGLAALLTAWPQIEVVAQASSPRMAVRLADELSPDVILIGMRTANPDGPQTTRAILERHPAMRIVALSVASSESEVSRVLKAGACGFVPKDTPIEVMVGAVQAAAQGASWLAPAAAEVVLGYVRRNDGAGEATLAPPDELSPRELVVLRLVANGMDNAEIGATLGISPRTVKNHVSSILAKLALPTRVHAAIYALRNGVA